MSELDKVIDVFIASKSETVSKDIKQEDLEDFKTALADKTKGRIIQEVKQQYKDEIIEKAKSEIEEEERRQYFSDLKKLMRNGFLIALLVGLSVNQATDVINYFRDCLSSNKWLCAFALCCIFLFLASLSYLKEFINEAKQFFEKYNTHGNKR